MEFYLEARYVDRENRHVSIPNGMEFYVTTGLKTYKNMCFNSQRDGILLSADRSLSFRYLTFQFPTGWNSTLSSLILCLSIHSFQFPTGWNSTLSPIKMATQYACFNSQRDGILRDQILRNHREKMFQFPTGWNSTFGRKAV